MKRLLLAMLLVCLAAAASGCGDDSDTADQGTSQAASSASSGDSGASSSSSSDDSGASSAASGDSGEDRSDDATVSRENPGFAGVAFDAGRSLALFDAEPLNAVTWSTPPTISAGALEASGTLTGGAVIFNPMVDGEGAGFIVYYKENEEPLALLLPDRGPMEIWESDHTIADMEHEFEGSSFEFRAYSPLFMDVGPGDLVIRVFGVDANGEDALLAVEPVRVE